MVTIGGWGVSAWGSAAWSAGFEEDVIIIITDAHKFAAFGTLLLRGDGGAPETFVVVAGVRNVDGPEQEAEEADLTVYDSPEGFEEFMPTILRLAPMVLDIVFDPANAQQAGLYDDYDTRTLRNFRIVQTDTAATVISFSAFVIGFTPTHPYDDALTATVELQPLGAVV